VTRSVKQAGELVLELRSAGAEPWVVPMIRIAAPDSWRGLDAALDDLAAYDAVLFTSQNAVDYTVLRARERGVDLRAAGLRSICVGERSAEAALRAGLAVHGVPERRFDAEGILDLLLRGESVRGRRYLLPRSSLARDVLPDGLRAAGATVDAVTVYVNEPAEVDAEALCERLRAGALDALLFTSPSTARRFSELLDEGAKSAAARCVVAAIGGVTADALSAVGLPADVVSERPAAAALVAALSQATRERRPER
ncbi:MAG: uroporphyrinogen-III synthase, partial [Myxococcota bacterium]